MKKLIAPAIMLILLSFLVSSCAGEDIDDSNEDFNTKMLTTTITEADLIGHWNLSKIIAKEPVDLNNDGIFNTDLMLETKCFNPMNIIYNGNMTFESVNARMDFKAGENNNLFFCMGNRTDKGTWSISDDVLNLRVEVDGVVYNHTKDLIMDGNSFSFKVTKLESKQYVTDPGDTSVSSVTVVELEYTKVQN